MGWETWKHLCMKGGVLGHEELDPLGCLQEMLTFLKFPGDSLNLPIIFGWLVLWLCG